MGNRRHRYELANNALLESIRLSVIEARNRAESCRVCQ